MSPPATDAAFWRWLHCYDPQDAEPGELLERFVAGLNACGLSIMRASLWLPTAHPELWGTQVVWTHATGSQVHRREHGITQTPTYLNTPGEAVHAARRTLRWRLDEPAAALPFPLLEEVRAEGASDYVIVPFATASATEQPWVTLATDAPGGFCDQDLALIEDSCQQLGWKTRLAIAESATRSLLHVYLGPNAAEHVLAGQFRRGHGTTIDAVIWFCDLRDFTSLGDRLGAGQLVAALDRYFECVAAAIEEAGGEILKFVGDAVLAVFPCAAGRQAAAAQALNAAQVALAALDQLSAARQQDGLPALQMGIALHVGEVLYGNVGGRSRLDFTVIGPAVNEAARVEALCKPLDQPLLMSADFVAALDDPCRVNSLGVHELRGVARPQELFTAQASLTL